MIPEHRQIQLGRTYAKRWDALDYACPVKGYRTAIPWHRLMYVLAVIAGLAAASVFAIKG